MKDKNTLLQEKQLLVINGSVVLWEPAKQGETLFGQTFIGCARKTDSSARVIRSVDHIESVEVPTHEQVEAYKKAVSRHGEVMAEYYQKNSCTGD